jgi:hypothetical protein
MSDDFSQGFLGETSLGSNWHNSAGATHVASVFIERVVASLPTPTLHWSPQGFGQQCYKERDIDYTHNETLL